MKKITSISTASEKTRIVLIMLFDSVCAAMPFWCIVALTMGFGGIFGILAEVMVYALLCVWRRSNYQLADNERGIYRKYAWAGVILGQLISFCFAMAAPIVTVTSYDGAVRGRILLCYGVGTIVAFICGRIAQYM